MHRWRAKVIIADGQYFTGRARILSERQLAVHGHLALALHTPCQVSIELPEKPGTSVFRRVDLQCFVSLVVFDSKGIRLEMTVKNIRPAEQTILRRHSQAER